MSSIGGPYGQHREGFKEFHQDDINIILHLFTTGAGIVGGCSLLYRCSNRSVGMLALLSAMYVTWLIGTVPIETVLSVLIYLAVVTIPIVRAMDLGVRWSVALIVLAYVGQDAAHFLTGEATYQSSYSSDAMTSVTNATTWIHVFSEHTLFLLPLTVDATVPLLPPVARSWFTGGLATPAWILALHEHTWILTLLLVWVCGCFALDSDSGPFPFMYVKRRVLMCNLGTESLKKDMASIRNWSVSHNPSRETTTHWWFSDLPASEWNAFNRIANSPQVDKMFREKFAKDKYAISVIGGMNEVYVSGPAKVGSSDTVFTTRHTDGPWALMPFCSTYRCILGLDSSAIYTTMFPSVPTEITCRTGDLVAFDYNREVHLIVENPNCKKEQAKLAPEVGGDAYRIVLKLHYCVYPRFLWPLGKLAAILSLGYNVLFRKIFLFSIDPSGAASRIMAFLVVNVTILYRLAIELGLHNMLYVMTLFVVGKLVHPAAFLVGTSFVHYPRYLVTYFKRSDVNYGTFKSDVFFYKIIAIMHITVRYLSVLVAGTSASTSVLITSLAMIVAGGSVSALATHALGMDGTYFGKELGMMEPKWITCFPYNVIPHPMTVGQLVAFAGVHLLPEFRAAWPWLMPAHCAFYIIVVLQEQFDIHGSKTRRSADELKEKSA